MRNRVPKTITLDKISEIEVGELYSIPLGKGYRLEFRKDEDAYGKHVHYFICWRKMPRLNDYYKLTEEEAYDFMHRLLANVPPRELKITHIVRMEEWYNPKFIEPINSKRNWTVEFISSKEEFDTDTLLEVEAWVRESLHLENSPVLGFKEFSDGIVHVYLPKKKAVISLPKLPKDFEKAYKKFKKMVKKIPGDNA